MWQVWQPSNYMLHTLIILCLCLQVICVLAASDHCNVMMDPKKFEEPQWVLEMSNARHAEMPVLLPKAGPMAWKATEILREQPRLWQCLAGCLPDAAQRSLALSAPAAAAHEESEDAGEGEVQEWLRKGDTAWRLAAEASALQLFALEAFASRAGSGNTSVPSRANSNAGGQKGSS